MSNEPLFKMQSSVTPENLEQALDQAISLEIATIPTYLYTYYSIKRSWSQGYAADPSSSYDTSLKADKKLVKDGGDPIGLSTAEGLRLYIEKHNTINLTKEEVKKMATSIQVYANKAAALTMSVVIEEMLHMSLSSNVRQAIYGPPDLVGGLPLFPAYLPGHKPYFRIDLAKFSQKQLLTFLKIESPEVFTGAQARGLKDPIDYTTIGAFYKMMQTCIMEHFPGPYQNNRPQLLPGKGFYGPNSINTVYYDHKHNPYFASADDSGNLRHVFDCYSAIAAMEEVIEQGEGHASGDHLSPSGEPVCPNFDWNDPDAIDKNDFDDKEKKELSHFDKFLKLYCQGEYETQRFSNAGLDFHSFFVRNLPDNPRTKQTKEHVDYASDDYIQATSNLINGLYTYLFLMAEACYYNDGDTQFEVFMMGIHKSMIWALSSMCNEVTSWTVKCGGKNYNVGPTFEPIDFSKSKKSPKQQLLDLRTAVAKEAAKLNAKIKDSNDQKDDFVWVAGYIMDFPDVALDHSVHKAPLLT